MSAHLVPDIDRRVGAAGVLLAVLLAGGIGGYALGVRHGHTVVTEGGPALEMAMMPAPPLLAALLDGIDATPAQRARIDSIVARHRPRTQAIVERSFPDLRAISDSMDREIRAVLTPGQRAKLDRLKVEPAIAPRLVEPGAVLPRGEFRVLPPPGGGDTAPSR